MENIIKSENLAFAYLDEMSDKKTKILALNGIDIEVKSGEFLAILGHNGSGKSTFAKLVNCLLTPSSGKLFVRELDTSVESNTWDIRRNAGMVFQNPDNQIIATVVEEDVAFGLENLGIEPDEIRKRVDSSLAAVGMSAFTQKQPHHLSGGQKQRIAIAGILAMRPDIIILDEPTAMLDPIGRKEVMQTIKMLKDEGITVVLITHYMEEAAEADRIIVMEAGNVAMQGTPREVFCRVEELKQIGLDVPQVTEIAYKLKQKGIDLCENLLYIDEFVNEIINYNFNKDK